MPQHGHYWGELHSYSPLHCTLSPTYLNITKPPPPRVDYLCVYTPIVSANLIITSCLFHLVGDASGLGTLQPVMSSGPQNALPMPQHFPGSVRETGAAGYPNPQVNMCHYHLLL